jgi:hypothetical protein
MKYFMFPYYKAYKDGSSINGEVFIAVMRCKDELNCVRKLLYSFVVLVDIFKATPIGEMPEFRDAKEQVDKIADTVKAEGEDLFINVIAYIEGHRMVRFGEFEEIDEEMFNKLKSKYEIYDNDRIIELE